MKENLNLLFDLLPAPGTKGYLVLGSRLIEFHSQNKTVAANAMAERYVSGHLS